MILDDRSGPARRISCAQAELLIDAVLRRAAEKRREAPDQIQDGGGSSGRRARPEPGTFGSNPG